MTPTGSPEVFKNLIDYIDKEISLIICGENEAGQAEMGSRASSQVANQVRVIRASELSEMISHTLTQSLVRWIVDLNFGVDVAAPTLTREFRIQESPLTMPDVSLMIQSGFTPRREWIERHFRVELEDKTKKEGAEGEPVKYDAQQDQDLFGSIFGDQAAAEAGGAKTGEGEAKAEEDLTAAADEMEMPEGAAPEESEADATPEPSAEDQLSDISDSLEENEGEREIEAMSDEMPEGDEDDEEDLADDAESSEESFEPDYDLDSVLSSMSGEEGDEEVEMDKE